MANISEPSRTSLSTLMIRTESQLSRHGTFPADRKNQHGDLPPRAGLREDRSAVTTLTAQLGLGDPDQNLCADADGLSPIQVHPEGVRQRYIPYTDKKLNWHTDGYYHRPDRIIRAMLLHCIRPAMEEVRWKRLITRSSMDCFRSVTHASRKHFHNRTR